MAPRVLNYYETLKYMALLVIGIADLCTVLGIFQEENKVARKPEVSTSFKLIYNTDHQYSSEIQYSFSRLSESVASNLHTNFPI